MPDDSVVTVYRSVPLSPARATLLGMFWLISRKSVDASKGEWVSYDTLLRLVSEAQKRGLIRNGARIIAEGSLAEGKRHLKWLESNGLISSFGAEIEEGVPLGFMGKSGTELPVGIFRYLDFWGFIKFLNSEEGIHG